MLIPNTILVYKFLFIITYINTLGSIKATANDQPTSSTFFLKELNFPVLLMDEEKLKKFDMTFEFVGKVRILSSQQGESDQDVSGWPAPAYIIEFEIDSILQGAAPRTAKSSAFLGTFGSTSSLPFPNDIIGRTFVIATYRMSDGSRRLMPFCPLNHPTKNIHFSNDADGVNDSNKAFKICSF